MLLILTLMLGGCTPRAETTTATRLPPNLSPRFWSPDGWAWGAFRIGDGPVVRYGVAAPIGVPRASLVIAAGRTEPIEAWFETVTDLTAQGFSVWVTDSDADGLAVIAGALVRPDPQARLFVVGHGDGAPGAIRAAQRGLPGLAGLILSSPDLEPPAVPGATWLARAGLGRFAAPGGPVWRRDGPDGVGLRMTHDAWRGKVVKAWQMANPDLRGGPAVADLAGRADALKALTPEVLKGIKTPVLMLTGGPPAPDQARLCTALAACTTLAIAGAWPDLHLETDASRGTWLTAIADHAK